MDVGGDPLEQLRVENARLIALLENHGVEWRLRDESPKVEPTSPPPLITSSLDTDAKLALFRRLFRGRADVFPVRWENKAGKSGYSPACAKVDVRIIDFIDAGHPALLRMWSKRQVGYKAMSYLFADSAGSLELLAKG